ARQSRAPDRLRGRVLRKVPAWEELEIHLHDPEHVRIVRGILAMIRDEEPRVTVEGEPARLMKADDDVARRAVLAADDDLAARAGDEERAVRSGGHRIRTRDDRERGEDRALGAWNAD